MDITVDANLAITERERIGPKHVVETCFPFICICSLTNTVFTGISPIPPIRFGFSDSRQLSLGIFTAPFLGPETTASSPGLVVAQH